ncbi:hypothetical protein D9615_004822 [Tricholomella constricta]|uniref:Uncharacterized protein n=1 Tax=Tricholomella constricta TaxID=117010 RepID=A0A8H5M6W4_9AGAR|nr:hypothetical protein D9615_004822 [Tricholomella constricta]
MISEIILQMRLFALYSLNRKILALMLGCFIVSTAASAAVMGSILSQISADAIRLTPNLIFCVPFNVSNHFFAFWIPMLAFESLLCGLALYKGYETFRSSSSPFRSGKHLVGILIRDSIFYFLVMFATYLTNLLVWTIAPMELMREAQQNLLEIPIGFSVALSCVLGNRMILNVREVNRNIERARSLEKPTTAAARSHFTGRSRSRSIILMPSHGGETSLSEIEMAQLRSMRAEA